MSNCTGAGWSGRRCNTSLFLMQKIQKGRERTMGKIVFGDREIITQSVYPYAYTNGKVVLRVSAREEDASEADLK